VRAFRPSGGQSRDTDRISPPDPVSFAQSGPKHHDAPATGIGFQNNDHTTSLPSSAMQYSVHNTQARGSVVLAAPVEAWVPMEKKVYDVGQHRSLQIAKQAGKLATTAASKMGLRVGVNAGVNVAAKMAK